MEKSLNKTYKCSKCKNKSSFQCSGCHKEVYCSPQCQQSDWPRHKTFCLQEQNKFSVNQSAIEEDNKKPPQIQIAQSNTDQLQATQKKANESKKVVVIIPSFPFIKEFSSIVFNKSNKKQIDKCYSSTLTHRRHFHEYLETNPFKLFIEYTISIYNKYRSCLHYIQHYLLLIRLYINESNITMAQQTLTTLTIELFEERLSVTLDKIFSNIEKTTSKKNTSIKPQNIQMVRQIYSSFLICLSILIKSSKQLNMNKQYYKYLYKYLQVYHMALHSLNQTKEKQCSLMRSNIYFIYGCLYSKEAQGSIAVNFFNQATQNEYKDVLLSKIIYSAYFNQGIITYSMNKLKEAKEKVLTALEIKLSLLNEQTMDDEQLRLIYLLLVEIEIENQNYGQANEFIDKAFDTIPIEGSEDDKDYNTNTMSKDDYRKQESFSRDIDNNINEKAINQQPLSKVTRLLKVLKDKIVKLQEMDYHSNREDEYEKIMSFLNEEMRIKKIAIDNEFDICDIKNFFLFMTKLSLHQIDVLNKTQGVSVCVNLPILFSKEFKNTLNPAQRSHFDTLKKLSLIRSNVLNHIDGKIELENLKYSIIEESKNLSITKLQDYSQMKDFLREVYPNSNQSQGNASFNRRRISELVQVNKKDSLRKVSFLYKNEYNISKMKMALKIYLNSGKHSYDDDTVNQMREFVSSPLYNLLLNRMTLENIKELEKEPQVLCELLTEYMKSLEKDSNESNSEDSELAEINKFDAEVHNLIKEENGDEDDKDSKDSRDSSKEIIKKAMTYVKKEYKRPERKMTTDSFRLIEDDNLYV